PGPEHDAAGAAAAGPHSLPATAGGEAEVVSELAAADMPRRGEFRNNEELVMPSEGRISSRKSLPAGGLALTALALAGLAACPTAGRANAIDMELKELGPKIIDYCKAQGWKNVGVLKFRTRFGQADPRWDAGQLGTIMAIRLENVLVLSLD